MTELEPVVYVVDDDASVRTSLTRLLRSAGLRAEPFGSAAEFLDREAMLGSARESACIILDVRMPGLDGLQLQARLADDDESLPIVFLTGHGDIPMAVETMRQGAVDFLTKPVDDERLLKAVRLGLERDRASRARREQIAGLRKRLETLTARELQVLRCVIAGALNKQIAACLGIAEKTVKIHRARVMEKMRATSVAELVHLSGLAGVSPIATAKRACPPPAAARRE